MREWKARIAPPKWSSQGQGIAACGAPETVERQKEFRMAKSAAEKVGIYAPYGWDDATYMAGSLYDLASNVFGFNVSYLSVALHEQGVHFLWDASVLNGTKHSFKTWADGCAHITWLHLHPGKLEAAIQMGCKNTLVALPHRLTSGDFPLLSRFNRVVCPTKALYDTLKNKVGHRNIQYVPWDTHLPIREKEGTRSSGRVRVLVPLDSPTARAIGPLVLHTLRILLDGNPDVEVTILYGKNWPQMALLALHELLDLHENRVKALKKPNHCQRIEEYSNTDWVFCPNIADNSGLAALEGLACGAPAVSFNAAPYNEFLIPFHNACLAKCDVVENMMGLPQIRPNARELLDTLYEACQNRVVLHNLRRQAWPELEERRRCFQTYWRRQWADVLKN
jgi:hypothetical protein